MPAGTVGSARRIIGGVLGCALCTLPQTTAESLQRTPLRPYLRFFMYDSPALDQSWLANCSDSAFSKLQDSAEGEGVQEANLYYVLRNHPYRTRNASEAALFYIPLWEYTSFRVGECKGTRHHDRMRAARQALIASPFFLRSGGRDHFWASSMAIEVTNAPLHAGNRVDEYIDKHKRFNGMVLKTATLGQRVQPMTKLLSETSVGRMKAFGRVPDDEARRHASRIARCTFDMGHQPNQAALRAFPPPTALRPTFLYFAGGLDVCCTGRHIRCEVGQLLLRKPDDVLIHIGLRGDTIRQMANGTAPPCTLKALKRLAAEKGKAVATLVEDLIAQGGQDEKAAGLSKYERMGQMMAKSTFCLCPAGDICTTSRFVTSIAAGCIPVVLCDGLEGPYGHQSGPHLQPVPYGDFWIKYPTASFMRDASGLVQLLRSFNATEIERRRAALRAHRRDILLQVPGSRAGTRFLEEVADCLEVNKRRPLGPIVRADLGKLLPSSTDVLDLPFFRLQRAVAPAWEGGQAESQPPAIAMIAKELERLRARVASLEAQVVRTESGTAESPRGPHVAAASSSSRLAVGDGNATLASVHG